MQVRQVHFLLFAENSRSGHKTLIAKYVFVYKSVVVTSPRSGTVVLINVEVVVDRKCIRTVTENSNIDLVLTLTEIAEITGITRQGVRDRIVKGEQTVSQLEEKLGLAGRFGNVTKTVGFIVERLETLRREQGVDVADILEAVKRLDA